MTEISYIDHPCCDYRLGGVPRWSLHPKSDRLLRIPDDIRRGVVFIGLPGPASDGTETIRYKGSAFFVTIGSDQPNQFTYLVTAAHVAASVAGKQFYIRMNRKDGKSAVLLCCDGSEEWFRHPTDPSVDVAVLPYAPPPEAEVEWTTAPVEVLATHENLSSCNLAIGSGDEVYIVGLFTKHSGNSVNIPIVRTGNIAMMPEEKIRSSTFGDMEAYLVEARSIGGLSGSPVFVRSGESKGGRILYDRNTLSLLGLVHGHFDVEVDGVEGAEIGNINSGIAVVVPAEKIAEVLYQPELESQRARKIEDIRNESSTTMDFDD